eukprot:scaffold107811_cov34-Prasinocladus_malaysianus.AAC.1
MHTVTGIRGNNGSQGVGVPSTVGGGQRVFAPVAGRPRGPEPLPLAVPALCSRISRTIPPTHPE